MRPAALLLLLTAATAPSPVRVRTSGPVTIWPKGALRDVHYCSREAPAPAERYWTPRWRDVARVDASLSFAMERWAIAEWEKGPRWLGNFADELRERFADDRWERLYSRNYYGLVRAGRRLLYVDLARRPSRDSRAVCDGGSNFMGLEIDPATLRVLLVRSNGVA